MPAPIARPHASDKLLQVAVALAAVGLMTAAFATAIGFEDPNDLLLLISAMLILAAPLSVLVHVWLNEQLSADERRGWLRQFRSTHAPRALSAYLSSTDRRAALRELTATQP